MTEEEKKARKRISQANYRAKLRERAAAGSPEAQALLDRQVAHSRAHYERNRDRLLEEKRAEYQADREGFRAYSRAYYEANRTRILAQRRRAKLARIAEVLQATAS